MNEEVANPDGFPGPQAEGNPRSRLSNVLAMTICLVACYATSALGALASLDAGEFYTQVTRPSWSPPGWLFGPVWMMLYTAMGISAGLIWIKRGFQGSWQPLVIFFLHLIPNALWSWVFFVWRDGGLAFATIVLLCLLILALTLMFFRISKLSAVLLMPYLLWVSFAALLNFQIWRLNPGTL